MKKLFFNWYYEDIDDSVRPMKISLDASKLQGLINYAEVDDLSEIDFSNLHLDYDLNNGTLYDNSLNKRYLVWSGTYNVYYDLTGFFSLYSDVYDYCSDVLHIHPSGFYQLVYKDGKLISSNKKEKVDDVIEELSKLFTKIPHF